MRGNDTETAIQMGCRDGRLSSLQMSAKWKCRTHYPGGFMVTINGRGDVMTSVRNLE
jgi:hypothetical protein